MTIHKNTKVDFEFDWKKDFKNILETSIKQQLKRAERETNTNPTEAQKEAGNYKKGRVSIKGLEIAIENPKGCYRRGVDGNGRKWETKMNNTYGYFVQTKAIDGDAIDVFLGDNLDSDKVFCIDQYKGDDFDETKIMLGFNSEKEAKEAYLSNYEKGWKGCKYITELDIETFKLWLNMRKSKKQRKPVHFYKLKAKENINNMGKIILKPVQKETDKKLLEARNNDNYWFLIPGCISNSKTIEYKKTQELLYEGLITSYPVDKVISIIKKSNLVKYISKQDPMTTINNNILETYILDIILPEENREQFSKLLDVCGYYISNEIQLKNNEINAYCEAKFDVDVSNMIYNNFDYLYHVTKKDVFLNRILKNGLCPKTRNIIGNTPERVYLATDKKNAMELFQNESYGMKEDGDYVVLKIQVYRQTGYKYYIDIRMDNAVYTLDNIAPQYLTPINEFTIGDNKNEITEEIISSVVSPYHGVIGSAEPGSEKYEIGMEVDKLSENTIENIIKDYLFENYLYEATADEIHQRYYPNIDREIFNQIANTDTITTNLENNKLGKYAKWLLNLYNNNQLKLEDLYKAKEYFPIFEKLSKSNKLENKDINTYKSISDLYKVVQPYINKPQTISKGDEIRKTKIEGADKVYEDSNFLAVRLKTKEAAIYYGKNTQWCTAATGSDNYFDDYNKKGPLYVVIDKQNNQKFQFHYETKQYMDETDSPIDFSEHEYLLPILGKLQPTQRMVVEADGNSQGMLDKNGEWIIEPYDVKFVEYAGNHGKGEIYVIELKNYKGCFVKNIDTDEYIIPHGKHEFIYIHRAINKFLNGVTYSSGSIYDLDGKLLYEDEKIGLVEEWTNGQDSIFGKTQPYLIVRDSSYSKRLIFDPYENKKSKIYRTIEPAQITSGGEFNGHFVVTDFSSAGATYIGNKSLIKGVDEILIPFEYGFKEIKFVHDHYNLYKDIEELYGIYKDGKISRGPRYDEMDESISQMVSNLLFENGFLSEATATEIHQKYYPNISKEDFNRIASVDKITTNLERDKLGMYAKWLLDLYKKGQLKLEDLYKAEQYIPVFNKLYKSNKLKNRNLNAYKSLVDMFDVVEPYLEKTAISKSDEKREIKEGGADKIYEDENWLVIHVKTKEAAIYYGKGTQWCTAATSSDNMFDTYNDRSPLYVLFDKKNNRKYQFHQKSGQFMDERDESVNVLKLITRKPALPEVVVKLYAKKDIEEFGNLYLITSEDKDWGLMYIDGVLVGAFLLHGGMTMYISDKWGIYNNDECIFYDAYNHIDRKWWFFNAVTFKTYPKLSGKNQNIKERIGENLWLCYHDRKYSIVDNENRILIDIGSAINVFYTDGVPDAWSDNNEETLEEGIYVKRLDKKLYYFNQKTNTLEFVEDKTEKNNYDDDDEYLDENFIKNTIWNYLFEETEQSSNIQLSPLKQQKKDEAEQASTLRDVSFEEDDDNIDVEDRIEEIDEHSLDILIDIVNNKLQYPTHRFNVLAFVLGNTNADLNSIGNPSTVQKIHSAVGVIQSKLVTRKSKIVAYNYILDQANQNNMTGEQKMVLRDMMSELSNIPDIRNTLTQNAMENKQYIHDLVVKEVQKLAPNLFKDGEKQKTDFDNHLNSLQILVDTNEDTNEKNDNRSSEITETIKNMVTEILFEDNKKLKDRVFQIPSELYLELKNKYNKVKDNPQYTTYKNYKRLQNIIEREGEITYKWMYTLVDWRDKYNGVLQGDKQDVEAWLISADKLMKWVDDELNRATTSVKQFGDTTSKTGEIVFSAAHFRTKND